jgi:hypothetical protein
MVHVVVGLGADVVAGVVERVRSSPRAVDQLVDDDEVAGHDVGPERADRAGSDDGPDTERRQRPDVGAERNAVGDVLVTPAVSGQERHPPTGDRTDGDRAGRTAVGRGDRHLDRVVEELVEARSADDPDLGAVFTGDVADRDQHRSIASGGARRRR